MRGDRLLALRKARNLKPEDISSEFGVSPRAYYSYESGDRDPSTLTLAKMAIYFGVSADYLIGIENKTSPKLEENEELLLNFYRGLSEFQKGQVFGRAETLSEQNENTVRVYRAAHSDNNHEDEILNISEERMRRLREAPESDEDL